jgi:hypothetical protein
MEQGVVLCRRALDTCIRDLEVQIEIVDQLSLFHCVAYKPKVTAALYRLLQRDRRACDESTYFHFVSEQFLWRLLINVPALLGQCVARTPVIPQHDIYTLGFVKESFDAIVNG